MLDADGNGDLINFTDDPDDWNGRPLVSPSALLMEGLSWDSESKRTILHPTEEELSKIIEHEVEEPVELSGESAQSIDKEDFINLQPRPLHVKKLNILTVQESKDIITNHEDSRDSGPAELNQGSRTRPESYRHSSASAIIYPTDEKFSIVPPDEEFSSTSLDEKIPVWTEQTMNGQASSTSSISRFDSISTANTGITNYTFTSDLSPLSPGPQSPLSDHTLPTNHRWSNPPAYIPLADNHLEQRLLDTMPQYSVSPDPVVRLDWAEDVLRHCAVSVAHEKRLAEMNVKEKVPRALLSERESALMAQATRVVQELRREENGRAYFLSARYIVPPEEKSHLYLLAYGKEHHRSLFYLGEISEQLKVVGDAVKRYKDGADRGDAACLYVSLPLECDNLCRRGAVIIICHTI